MKKHTFDIMTISLYRVRVNGKRKEVPPHGRAIQTTVHGEGGGGRP